MVFLFLADRYYEAEICAILLLLIQAFAWYNFLLRSKIFSFCLKTMGYNQVF